MEIEETSEILQGEKWRRLIERMEGLTKKFREEEISKNGLLN